MPDALFRRYVVRLYPKTPGLQPYYFQGMQWHWGLGLDKARFFKSYARADRIRSKWQVTVHNRYFGATVDQILCEEVDGVVVPFGRGPDEEKDSKPHPTP